MDIKEAHEHNYETAYRHPWEIVRSGFIEKLIRRFRPQLFGSGRTFILDVGSGDQFMAAELSLKLPNATFYCIEPGLPLMMHHAYNVRYSAQQIPISVALSFEEHLMVHPYRIDAVILADVLQQCPDPAATLREILTHPGIGSHTIWFITAPAFNSATSPYDAKLGNLRRYKARQMNTLLESVGLQTAAVHYFFFVPLIYRLLGLSKSLDSQGLSNQGPFNFKENLMLNVLNADIAISSFLGSIGINLPGLSVYAVAALPEKLAEPGQAA
ncbi:MAG: class I SAM-dependent methyltransferase [Bacteroidota bacterium]